jgi:hypothetical protein
MQMLHRGRALCHDLCLRRHVPRQRLSNRPQLRRPEHELKALVINRDDCTKMLQLRRIVAERVRRYKAQEYPTASVPSLKSATQGR